MGNKFIGQLRGQLLLLLQQLQQPLPYQSLRVAASVLKPWHELHVNRQTRPKEGHSAISG